MKKTYSAPRFSHHGTVEKITNYFGSGAGDVFTGPNPSSNADDSTNATGSIDACATRPGSGQCIDPTPPR